MTRDASQSAAKVSSFQTRPMRAAPWWRLGAAGRMMARDAFGRVLLGVIALSLPIIFISLTASFPLFALSIGDLLYVAGSLGCVILLHTTPLITAVMIIWAYGRFMTDSVAIALCVAGRSPLATAAPGLAVALLVSIGMLALSNVLVPAANRNIHDMLQFLRRNMDFSALDANRFYDFRHERITFYFAAKDPSGRLTGVFIHKRLPPDEHGVARSETYYAREALVIGEPRDKGLLMIDGGAHLPRPSDSGFKIMSFDAMTWRPQNGLNVTTRTILHHDEIPTLTFLTGQPPEVAAGLEPLRTLRELLKRFAYPVLPLAHVLLGLGIAMTFASPAGRGRGTTVAIAVAAAAVMIVHVIYVILAEAVALTGPATAIWFIALLWFQTVCGLLLIVYGQEPILRAACARLSDAMLALLRRWNMRTRRPSAAGAK